MNTIARKIDESTKSRRSFERERLPLVVRPKILVIDDDLLCLKIYTRALKTLNFDVYTAQTLEKALEIINSETDFSVILLDIHLPDASDLSGMKAIQAASPVSTLIVFTIDENIEQAIHFMSAGADDFLLKTNDVLSNVAKIKQHMPSDSELDLSTKKQLKEHGIVGQNPMLVKVLKNIEHLKEINSPVLIYGESGTGKEKIAHYVHKTSSRAEGPFIAINCASIAPNLFEAELFGYKKGAFTDAKKDKKGFFEMCNNGTLFLDEIGELPLELQAKLLRVVERSEVIPVGSCTPVPVDTRIVSATNRHLNPKVQQEVPFRKDLYYRLSVFKFTIPPLRERAEDIERLVSYFMVEFSEKYNKSTPLLTEKLKQQVAGYSWPGNIRELKNFVERFVVLSSSDPAYMNDIIMETFPSENRGSTKTIEEHELVSKELKEQPFDEAEHNFRKEYVKFHMKKSNNNIAEVARVTNKSRMWVYRMNAKN